MNMASKQHARVSLFQPSTSARTVAGIEINWSLCVLCQEEKDERLTCPFQTTKIEDPNRRSGYTSLATHLQQFEELGKLPSSICLKKLDEGAGVEATLMAHRACWHKTCRNKYDERKLQQVRNLMDKDRECRSPLGKRTRMSSEKFKVEGDMCFFCDKSIDQDSRNYRKAATKVIDERVRQYATFLSDNKILAKLSGGDMVAIGAVYHAGCLSAFYIRYNRAVSLKESTERKDNTELNVKCSAIAFAELVAYIEQTRTNSTTAPVFKLADLAKLYTSRLQQLLEKETEQRVNTSKLKERILAHIPNMTAHNKGRDVLLLFEDDVGQAIISACQFSSDSDAVHLARAANIIRSELFKEEYNQPFTGFFNATCQETSVPNSLLSLITMIIKGPSIEDQSLQSSKQAALTIAQLIKFNSTKGGKQDSTRIIHARTQETPLPIYVGLMLHTHTRKRELVDKMFDLGMSVSYDRVLRISSDVSTAVCEKYETEKVVCPVSLRGGLFTTAAIDNIDHNLSSTTAKDSFHGTSISLFQHPLDSEDGTDRGKILIQESSLSRSIPPLPTFYTEVPALASHNMKKNQPTSISRSLERTLSPEFITTNYDWLDKVNSSVFSQNGSDQDNIISWSAYHAERQINNRAKIVRSPIALLPLFPENSHSVAMIRHSMDVIRNAVHHLNPGQVPVLTVDQPLYAIAKQIQWTWSECYGEECFVILPAGMHIEMAAFKVAGDWLCGSGWPQVLVDAKITSIGTADSYLKVSHLGRTRHAHQVTVAALYILQRRAYRSYIESTENPLQFESWCEEMSSKYPQFRYWATTMQLELTVLLFVRSLRESNYSMYLEALTELVTWFFALDHTNYARWISISLADMAELPSRHPDIAKQFDAGNFTVKKTSRAFSAIAIDQAHEQNNKMIKDDGGAVGILSDSKKLTRWMVAGPEIARVIQEFESALQRSSAEDSRHHEQTPSIQDGFRKDVISLVETIDDNGNPFEERSTDLIVLNSRDIVTSAGILNTVQNIIQIGKKQFENFVTERLINKSKNIYDVISRNKLPLLNHRLTGPSKEKQQLAMAKSNGDLFSRLFISCQVRGGNLDDFFKHENMAYPPSLSTQGNLYLGTKSDLMYCLQELAEPRRVAPVVEVILLDGPVIVQLLNPGSVKTFGNYAHDVFLPYVMSQLQRANRVDVVWDTYRNDSLKEQTRESRGLGIRRRVAADVALPKDWKTFLRSNENKTELFRFLSHAINNLNVDIGKELVTTIGESVLCSSNRDVSLLSPCTHEEADSRIMLHAFDAFQTGKRKILIRTVDTDLVVLAVWLVQTLGIEELWIAFGKGNDFRYIPVHEITAALGPDKSCAMLGFHALTGCDTTSAFVGRGKKSSWNAWKAFPDVTSAFTALSTAYQNDITEETTALIQRYTVLLYDRTSTCTSVDVARRKLFANKGRPMESIPPTLDALNLHVKRAALQATTWGQCISPRPTLPDPTEWGWIRNISGKFQPVWRTLPEVAKTCQEHAKNPAKGTAHA